MKTLQPLLCICICIFVLGLASQYANAANDRATTQYKCHFELIGGEQVVQYQMSKARSGQMLSQQMQGKIIYAKNGVSKKHIFKVVECIDANATFKAAASQKLDQRTLN